MTDTPRPLPQSLAPVSPHVLGATPSPAPEPGPDWTPLADLSLLQRLKLTEPVRLYLHGVLTLVVIPAAVLAGVLTGDWVEWAGTAAATVLGVGAAGEAARASVYSPVGMMAAARDAVAEVGR